MSDEDKKSIYAEVGGWLWGTIEGGFNEQQSISQVIVDAAIGMIPVVGDVTAVRDLFAVLLGMALDPKKREDKLQWLTLVLLLFALVPVVGGVVKGVGKLVLRAGEDAAKDAELLRDTVHYLNRVGEGDAVTFLKQLNFESYAATIRGQWHKLTQRLDDVLGALLRRTSALIPDAMAARLRALQNGLREVATLGEQRIPDALKELNRRLQAVQKAVYEGEWHAIAGAATSTTREAEARLVEKVVEGKTVKEWEATELPFPPSTKADYHHVPGWPDIAAGDWLDKRSGLPWVIGSFSGPIRAVKIPPGTKIRRVVTKNSTNAGPFWFYELPPDGPTWRKNWAVLDGWSTNGVKTGEEARSYLELTVPEPGLWAWEGRTATQIENRAEFATFGQVLPGGATQLLIDFNRDAHAVAKEMVEQLPRIPTNWTNGHLNLNLPAEHATVRVLPPSELAPKMSRAGRAAQVIERVSRSVDDHQTQTEASP